MLATKLYAPVLRDKLVQRPRLLNKLNLGLKGKLTLVCASAGYGKTTLVVNWLKESGARFTWLSLDQNDNDPNRFLAYLVAALQKLDSSLGASVSELIEGPQQPAFEVILEILVNDLAKCQEQLVLVLDDYHLITNKVIHAGLGFLIEYKPPSLHLVLTTREDPPLALAKMRVRNEITEIRVADLMFKQAEIQKFVQSAVGLILPEHQVAILAARTEGWIAGLQLAAISLQGKDEAGIEKFVNSFGGSHRYVIDYLMEEVLKSLSDEVRSFLCQTALLERFCPELCNAVTGRSDSQGLLNRLENLNLFIIPLDDNSIWFRYHHLFSSVLSAQLGQKDREEVCRRAARWFEAQGVAEEGTKYALAAGDLVLAGRLIAKAAPAIFEHGEMTMLLELTDCLPEEILLANLELAAYRAWALFYTGQGEKSGELVSKLGLKHGQHPSKLLGRLTALKGWIDYSTFGPNGGNLAREALEYLADQDNFRLMTLILLGEYQRNLGQAEDSRYTFRQAFELSRQADYSFASLGALVALAVALELTGKRLEAAALCRETIERFTRDREPTPLLGFVYTRLGLFHYIANELEPACAYLQQGVELCRSLAADRVMGGEGKMTLGNVQLALGQMDLALVLHCLGRREEAWTVIAEAKSLIHRTGIVPFISKLGALEADLLLREGELEEAAARLAEISLSPGGEQNPAREEEYLVLARSLLAQGKPQEANNMLGQLEQSAVQGGRQARLINIYILLALVEVKLDNPVNAQCYLKKALRIASPGQYLRPFIDLGGEIRSILLLLRPAAPTFVDKILGAISEPVQAKSLRGETGLIEGLSEREIEILRLVAQGLSNGEIAAKLFITPGTTKWHLNNIFSKLGVNSRTKAVSLARELELL